MSGVRRSLLLGEAFGSLLSALSAHVLSLILAAFFGLLPPQIVFEMPLAVVLRPLSRPLRVRILIPPALLRSGVYSELLWRAHVFLWNYACLSRLLCGRGSFSTVLLPGRAPFLCWRTCFV